MQRAMPDSQWYPWNLLLINIVEDFIVFLGLKNYKSLNLTMKEINRNKIISEQKNVIRSTVPLRIKYFFDNCWISGCPMWILNIKTVENNFCKFNLEKLKNLGVFILGMNCLVALAEKNCLKMKTGLTLSIFNLKLS